jgi:hypothetical protein
VKQDPNSVKKNLSTPEAQERISKRIRTGKFPFYLFLGVNYVCSAAANIV